MNIMRRAGDGHVGEALLAALIVALFAGGPGPGCAAAAGEETIDVALLRQAPRVLGYLQEHGYRSVGVLKFRVQKGDEPVSDRVGTLNLDLAARLEVALVLTTDIKAPLGIIHDASAVAAKVPGANHLTEPGRRALFQARYPLAWGGQAVEPDAFLTGVARLSPDLRAVTVSLLAFGRDGGKLEKVTDFTAATDPPTLTAAGESFVLTRGLFEGGQVMLTKAVESALKVKTGQAVNPVQSAEAPVTLEVFYDGQRVPLELRRGQAWVREPQAGQTVAFMLRRVGRTPDRYGVVLLVNGENTLYRERMDPRHCQKWVLGPEDQATSVTGFQVGEGKAETFRVLSRAESARDVMDYGSDVGTISLVVFREASGGGEPLALEEEAEDLAAVSRAAFPAKPPENLSALRHQLHQGSINRGLIVQGQEIGAAIRRVKFRPDSTPVMSATITYYRP
jgi:hypothetical protein